jgi:hypothetical protein
MDCFVASGDTCDANNTTNPNRLMASVSSLDSEWAESQEAVTTQLELVISLLHKVVLYQAPSLYASTCANHNNAMSEGVATGSREDNADHSRLSPINQVLRIVHVCGLCNHRDPAIVHQIEPETQLIALSNNLATDYQHCPNLTSEQPTSDSRTCSDEADCESWTERPDALVDLISDFLGVKL